MLKSITNYCKNDHSPSDLQKAETRIHKIQNRLTQGRDSHPIYGLALLHLPRKYVSVFYRHFNQNASLEDLNSQQCKLKQCIKILKQKHEPRKEIIITSVLPYRDNSVECLLSEAYRLQKIVHRLIQNKLHQK